MVPSPCTFSSLRSTGTASVEPSAGGVLLANTLGSPILNNVVTVISFDDGLDGNAQAICCGLASSQGLNHFPTLGPDKRYFALRVARDQKLHANGPPCSTFPLLVVDRSANEPPSSDSGFFGGFAYGTSSALPLPYSTSSGISLPIIDARPTMVFAISTPNKGPYCKSREKINK
ncbi:hypothetical protein NC652_004504 [Populus alba x Populus x berolinensis]|nr:hypothetical protein NC652_004504 [Populus alba x Populus x berolinensis]